MPISSPQRLAFVMQLHPGQEELYRARHTPIWPELESLLKASGVQTYSIFLHPETLQLFAYAEVEDVERWQHVADSDICRRWWQHMSEIMPSNLDGSPVAVPLTEMFHLESGR